MYVPSCLHVVYDLMLFQVHYDTESVYSENTDDLKAKCTTLTLKPPLTVVNQLPYAVTITPAVSVMSTCVKSLEMFVYSSVVTRLSIL